MASPGSQPSDRYVSVEHVVEWLRGDLATQLAMGPPGSTPPSGSLLLDLLAEDFEQMIASTEIPSEPMPQGCKPSRDSRGDVWCFTHRRDYGECQSLVTAMTGERP